MKARIDCGLFHSLNALTFNQRVIDLRTSGVQTKNIMAIKKKDKSETETKSSSRNSSGSDDFSAELIKQLNKEHSSNIAFNLGAGIAPTEIKRWISTGSRQLDCICSNKGVGGFAEGRIVEIQGASSSGKSHIAYECIKSCQKQGGIAVYIDTENATSLENLKKVGIDIKNRFVFVQSSCIEEVFAVAESAILKARGMTKDVPVVIIWDSVAATAPKAELEGEYDQNTIGLAARVIGKGLRKITNIIGNQNVLFLLINQQRQKIGVMFGDPTTTPGGMAIPYACSTRVSITSSGQKQVKDSKGNVIGISVSAKTIKNKIAPPFRSVQFQIIFGHGIVEHEEVFDAFREHCSKQGAVKVTITPEGKGEKPYSKLVSVDGTGAWKTFTVAEADTGEIETEIKFYKQDFGEKVLYVPEYKEYMDALFEATFVVSPTLVKDHATYDGIDSESYTEHAQLLLNQAEHDVLALASGEID